jgi:hypothetical protein
VVEVVEEAVVTAGRTTRFLGAEVMTGQRGPDSGDGQLDGTVPGHGGDG